MGYREILNIERFEMMEERLGICINEINAEIGDIDGDYDGDGDSKFRFNIRGEVTSVGGGNLDESVTLKISLYNSNGKFIGLIEKSFYKDYFFGVDVFEESVYHRDNDVEKIRIIPTKKY